LTLDLLLAIAHHLLILLFAALLTVELVLLMRPLDNQGATIIARVDGPLGGVAVLLLAVGFLRVFLGAKPEAFYLQSPLFWAKIAAFLAVGILTIIPTVRFIRWSRSAKSDAGFVPPAGEITAVRRLVATEALVFLLIPTFAALMARGYGLG